MQSTIVGVAAAIVAVATAGAVAQIPMPHVKSGQPLVIRVAFNCQTHIPPRLDGSASHGTLTTRLGKGNHCGNANEPHNELIYTSEPGFKGADGVNFFLDGQMRSFPVIVD
ncbi:MAG: hypothetical protein U1E56_01830 [Bauldia sp.]